MKVEDYLTQEMIDKLQNAVDDNNGVIDSDDLHPLLDGFMNFLINNKNLSPRLKVSFEIGEKVLVGNGKKAEIIGNVENRRVMVRNTVDGGVWRPSIYDINKLK